MLELASYFSLRGFHIRLRKKTAIPKRYRLMIALSFLVITYHSAKAQTFDYEHNIAIFNPFQQPNIVQGDTKGKLEYYGSGDVDNNGVIDKNDAQAIYDGIKNDMADVNGDQVIDSTDAKMIEEYVDGTRSYLPGHWNELWNIQGVDIAGVSKGYLARKDWFEKMVAVDKTDTNQYVLNSFDCTEFSNQTFIDFTGLKNFKNYPDYQKFIDHGVTNGRFNIPIFTLYTYPDPDKVPSNFDVSGSTHQIDAAFLGSKYSTEKIDPEVFSQYYPIEPQNDKPVVAGDANMNDNKPVIVKAIAYMPSSDGTNWAFKDQQLVQFDLSNGVATVSAGTLNPVFLLENPERMNPQVVLGNTSDTVQVNYSANMNVDDSVKVSAQANTDLYQDRIKLDEWGSDTTSTSPYPNIEFNFTMHYQAWVNVGMQPPFSAEKAVAIKVRDMEAPQGEFSQTSAQAEPGITPEELAKEYITNVSDNSGLAVDTLLTADTTNAWTDTDYYTHTNVSAKLVDPFGNEKDLGTFEAQVREYATDVADISANENSLRMEVLGNPVTEATRLQVFSHDYLSKGEIVIYSSQGKMVNKIEVDNIPAGGERTISYNSWSALQPGIYLLTFTGNGHRVKEKVQVR